MPRKCDQSQPPTQTPRHRQTTRSGNKQSENTLPKSQIPNPAELQNNVLAKLHPAGNQVRDLFGRPKQQFLQTRVEGGFRSDHGRFPNFSTTKASDTPELAAQKGLKRTLLLICSADQPKTVPYGRVQRPNPHSPKTYPFDSSSAS